MSSWDKFLLIQELEGGDLPPSSSQRLTGMYKVANMFTLSANQTRGHHLKLVKKRCNTTQRLNTFFMRIVDHWNNLSEDTVTANCRSVYIKRYKILFIDGYSIGFPLIHMYR
jgi:hypothetical protein